MQSENVQTSHYIVNKINCLNGYVGSTCQCYVFIGFTLAIHLVCLLFVCHFVLVHLNFVAIYLLVFQQILIYIYMCFFLLNSSFFTWYLWFDAIVLNLKCVIRLSFCRTGQLFIMHLFMDTGISFLFYLTMAPT